MHCFNNIYDGAKVLITGNSGFKGAWLSMFLKELGSEVIGYSLSPPTSPSLFTALGLAKEITQIHGDVRDLDEMATTFEKFQPEFVFHLAAQPLVRYAYKEPRLTYETNIMGTVNLLECVRMTPSVKVVINVTSDKCYENKEWLYGYREEDPMGGYDPYSSSKGASELVTAAYKTSFFDVNSGVALSSVRAGNVIGGGDWADDRLIPDCVRSLACDQKIVIRCPRAIRPWQYVLDPLSGYLWLGSMMYGNIQAFSSGWNFGPSDTDILNVEDVVKLVVKCWGKGTYKIDDMEQPHEAGLLKLDCSKARVLLNWRPAYDICTAIEKTISWYVQFYEGKANIYSLTKAQIMQYIEGAKTRKIAWSLR